MKTPKNEPFSPIKNNRLYVNANWNKSINFGDQRGNSLHVQARVQQKVHREGRPSCRRNVRVIAHQKGKLYNEVCTIKEVNKAV